MKEQTFFHISTPCHEDWNNMTPEGKGRFCAACSKQVVDFTLMTDQQVLNYFKEKNENVCGRFAADQLNRAMQPAKKQKIPSKWWAAIMPVLLFFNRAGAQKKQDAVTSSIGIKSTEVEFTGFVTNRKEADKEKPIIGDTTNCTLSNTITITGRVTDEHGLPLLGASVIMKGENRGAATDTSGEFSFIVSRNTPLPVLKICYVGYEDLEINLATQSSEIVYVNDENGFIKEIKISGNLASMKEVITMGLIVSVKKHAVCKKAPAIKKSSSNDTAGSKKIFFTLSPNPILRGQDLKIRIEKKGDYTIRLWDFNSNLLKSAIYKSDNNKSLTEIEIPSNISSGIYYLQVIESATQKQSTEKIIVQ